MSLTRGVPDHSPPDNTHANIQLGITRVRVPTLATRSSGLLIALCGSQDYQVAESFGLDLDYSLPEDPKADYRKTNFTGSPNLINSQDQNAIYHDFRFFRSTDDRRPMWYWQQMTMMK